MSHQIPARRLRRLARHTAASLGAAFLIVQAAGGAAGAAEAGAGDPWTAEQQQFVYELNVVRENPSVVEAWAGLPAGTLQPAPPLAVNDLLAAAAVYRANEMADFDYFSHQSPVTGLWPNAVARSFGYPLPQFWPAEANSIESIHRGNPSLLGVLQAFANSSSHRTHLMGQSGFAAHREIGVGARLDDRVWAVLTATDEGAAAFLTGVVFADLDGNGRMDLGEGLPGVTVTAGGSADLTNAGGGWSIRVAPGTYQVAAAGGAFSGVSFVDGVAVGSANVGIDFPSGANPILHGAQPPPPVTPAVVPASTPQQTAGITLELCAGLTPTIAGTDGPDQLQGTAGRDIIQGGAGDDSIDGLGGNDLICGGGGNDTLYGGTGYDRLYGEGGNDTIDGGAHNDTVYGGPGDDIFADSAGGNDLIFGEDGHDSMNGGIGSDRIYGGPGDDTIVGGDGYDRLYGEDGHDYLEGGARNDTIYGGNGQDTILGGDGNDTVRGDGDGDYIDGGPGSDRIYGGSGADTLDGALGNDTLYGGADDDLLSGSDGYDSLRGDTGTDRCLLGERFSSCEIRE